MFFYLFIKIFYQKYRNNPIGSNLNPGGSQHIEGIGLLDSIRLYWICVILITHFPILGQYNQTIEVIFALPCLSMILKSMHIQVIPTIMVSYVYFLIVTSPFIKFSQKKSFEGSKMF